MRRRVRQRIGVTIGVVGMAFGALLPAAASANIVIGQSIDGVKLGMTEAEVEAAAGPPGLKEPPDFQGDVAWKYPTGLEGAVGFDKEGRVEGLWTASKSQKTNKGIGAFSSYAKFRRAYPKLKCGPGPWNPKQSLSCSFKEKIDGKRVVTSILFYTKAMGVREVDLGYET